jgi:polyphosphate kinase
MKKNELYFNRELSWLSFNYRVLQEAKDKSNPLFERLKFLAIYSSNLDEFFRVRVASLRTLLDNKKKVLQELDFDPKILLKDIHKIVYKQQEEFGKIYHTEILPELKNNKIVILKEKTVSADQIRFISEYYSSNISYLIQPILLIKKKIFPFLKNQSLYLAVRLKSKKIKDAPKKENYKYSLIEIPSQIISRFIKLPSNNENNY